MSFAIFAFEFLRPWVIMVLIVVAFFLGDANGSLRSRRRIRTRTRTTRMEEEKQISERMMLEGIIEERVEKKQKKTRRGNGNRGKAKGGRSAERD